MSGMTENPGAVGLESLGGWKHQSERKEERDRRVGVRRLDLDPAGDCGFYEVSLARRGETMDEDRGSGVGEPKECTYVRLCIVLLFNYYVLVFRRGG